MIIPVSVAASSSSTNPKLPPGLAKISHDEIVLVELQGSLEVECNHASERDGKAVGTLGIDEATDRPTLHIGHHLLEGNITTLPKPLAVLLRSNAADKTERYRGLDEDGMDCDSDQGQGKGQAGTVGWDVVAIVKRKIVFSKRPMPVVGRHI